MLLLSWRNLSPDELPGQAQSHGCATPVVPWVAYSSRCIAVDIDHSAIAGGPGWSFTGRPPLVLIRAQVRFPGMAAP